MSKVSDVRGGTEWWGKREVEQARAMSMNETQTTMTVDPSLDTHHLRAPGGIRT